MSDPFKIGWTDKARSAQEDMTMRLTVLTLFVNDQIGRPSRLARP